MLATLVAAIPDAYVGDDGVFYIKFQIEAGQLENLFLAHQILLQDQFIQTASGQALQRHGEQYKFPPKLGTKSVGTLRFEGEGGTYIPIGAEAGYDPGGGINVLYFNTTIDGTIPNPGEPIAPVATDTGAGGLPAGTYEYAVTFVTDEGETEPGELSNTVVIGSTRTITVTGIPVGGPGTVARKIYRMVDGGPLLHLAGADATLNDNTTTSIVDGGLVASTSAPAISTAERITLDAVSQDVGAESNVAIGTITQLTNAPATLVGVVNETAFIGASDPEDTEEYRRRLLEFIQSPGTGSPSDLKVIAEEINGVESATVFENVPGPGQVTVRISAPGGTIPGIDVINAVQAALDDYDLSNLEPIAATFIPQPENVTVDVTTKGTFTLSDVTDSVRAAIQAYINGLDVGETMRTAGIVDSVFGLSGIADVVVTVPSGNVTCNPDEKITPGTILVI